MRAIRFIKNLRLSIRNSGLSPRLGEKLDFPIEIIGEYREKLSAIYKISNGYRYWCDLYLKQYDKAIDILKFNSKNGIAFELERKENFILNEILKNRKILPLLLGINPDLDVMISKKLSGN